MAGIRQVASQIGRAFGGLRIRYKLMVLHNLFFFALAGAVWFTLIPLVENGAASARDREFTLARAALMLPHSLVRADLPAQYEYREGSASVLGIPTTVLAELETNPAKPVSDPDDPHRLYSSAPGGGVYRSLYLSDELYASIVRESRLTLLVVLAIVYGLAVLALELSLMKHYIYGPLRILLDADKASREGNTERELIAESIIRNDELGQLMSSRNATVQELRRRERELEGALGKLQEVAANLQRKNDLLETAKQNIADQDRLASLGLLSASVAHELNTPLAVLCGSIEKLLETVPDEASQVRLQRTLRVAQRLQKISNGLVDFARARTQQTESISIHALVDESWELVTIDEKADSVHFRNDVQETHSVLGNPDRLVQLFVNLLHNALHAVQPGGHIRVRSEREVADEGNTVTIAVEDDGPGIPPDVLPEIFEAFITTRLDSRGTGLGLTVAEGIAHQHGGRITAVNRPGGGACLEVRLPEAPATSDTGVPAGPGSPHMNDHLPEERP